MSDDLKLELGDSYLAVDARDLQFGTEMSSQSLLGATPHLQISKMIGGAPSPQPIVDVPGTIVEGSVTIDGTTYPRVFQFELTAQNTAPLKQLTPYAYVYRVVLIWASSAKNITNVRGGRCTLTW